MADYGKELWADLTWCEHCRDHFVEDHYDDDGSHRSGAAYGPVGAEKELVTTLRAELQEVERERERYREALERIAKMHPPAVGGSGYYEYGALGEDASIARAALKGERENG